MISPESLRNEQGATRQQLVWGRWQGSPATLLFIIALWQIVKFSLLRVTAVSIRRKFYDYCEIDRSPIDSFNIFPAESPVGADGGCCLHAVSPAVAVARIAPGHLNKHGCSQIFRMWRMQPPLLCRHNQIYVRLALLMLPNNSAIT